MKDSLKTGFAERITAQTEAKKALLAKFKPKPMLVPEEFVDSRTRKAEELEAVRRERAEAKEAARLAAIEAERIAREEAEKAEEEALLAKKGERKVRKALTKAEQKIKRDARYAARKARV